MRAALLAPCSEQLHARPLLFHPASAPLVRLRNGAVVSAISFQVVDVRELVAANMESNTYCGIFTRHVCVNGKHGFGNIWQLQHLNSSSAVESAVQFVEIIV